MWCDFKSESKMKRKVIKTMFFFYCLQKKGKEDTKRTKKINKMQVVALSVSLRSHHSKIIEMPFGLD